MILNIYFTWEKNFYVCESIMKNNKCYLLSCPQALLMSCVISSTHPHSAHTATVVVFLQ